MVLLNSYRLLSSRLLFKIPAPQVRSQQYSLMILQFKFGIPKLSSLSPLTLILFPLLKATLISARCLTQLQYLKMSEANPLRVLFWMWTTKFSEFHPRIRTKSEPTPWHSMDLWPVIRLDLQPVHLKSLFLILVWILCLVQPLLKTCKLQS